MIKYLPTHLPENLVRPHSAHSTTVSGGGGIREEGAGWTIRVFFDARP